MAITLTGGELALYDGWHEVARAIKERRLVLSLLTNATLFGGDGLDAIADLHPLSVSASLYGSEPGLHDAVTPGVRVVRAHRRGAVRPEDSRRAVPHRRGRSCRRTSSDAAAIIGACPGARL